MEDVVPEAEACSPYEIIVAKRLTDLLGKCGKNIEIDTGTVTDLLNRPVEVSEPSRTDVVFTTPPKFPGFSVIAGSYRSAETSRKLDVNRITVVIPRRSVTKSKPIEVVNTISHEAKHAADHDRIGHKTIKGRSFLFGVAIYSAVAVPLQVQASVAEHDAKISPLNYAMEAEMEFDGLAFLLANLMSYWLNPYEIRARWHAHKQSKVPEPVRIYSANSTDLSWRHS